ncbi:MAG: GAF domain-containing protein [Pseudomonadota bacterium]
MTTTTPQRPERASRIHLLLFLMMLGIAMLMGWTAWTARSMVETFLPQAAAAAAARLQVTEAHLWLEEIVSGDASESPQQVWDLIAQTRALLQALQSGGTGTYARIRAIADPAARSELSAAQETLAQFEQLARARIGQSDTGVGTGIDSRFDDTYAGFIAITGALDARLHAAAGAALTRFTWLQAVLIALVIMLFGWLLMLLRRQEASERDAHVRSLQASFAQLERSREELERQNRLRGTLVELGDRLQGLDQPTAVAQAALDLLCEKSGAQAGSCWGYRPGQGLQRLAGHALPESHTGLRSLAEGEGLPGRVAQDRSPLAIDVPSDYFTIASGIGQAPAPHLRIEPLLHDGQTVAVMEFAFLQAPAADAVALIAAALPVVAIRLQMVERAAWASDARRPAVSG